MTNNQFTVEHEGMKFRISVGTSCYYVEPVLEEGQTITSEQMISLIEDSMQTSKALPENPVFTHSIEEHGNGYMVKLQVEKIK